MIFFSNYSDLTIRMTWVLFVVFILITTLKFSSTYLRYESMRKVLFVNILVLWAGIISVTFARSIESAFIGWELVGVASFFLIGFFKDRTRPIRNSFRAWVYYRLGDFFFLNSIAFMHFRQHELSALFLILAVIPKSGVFPFSAWLYRALEGPTPSSALFYGALSSHLGALILILFQDHWNQFSTAKILLFLLGFLTFIFSVGCGRTRPDVKSTLAFATQAQIGVIFIELSFSLYWLAFLHLISNAILRAWQFLRAGTVIQEFHPQRPSLNHSFKNAGLENLLPRWIEEKLYWYFLDSGYLSTPTDLTDCLFSKFSIKRWVEVSVFIQIILCFIPLLWVTQDSSVWQDWVNYSVLQVTTLFIWMWTFRFLKNKSKPVCASYMRVHEYTLKMPEWFVLALLLSLIAIPGTLTFHTEEHLLNHLWESIYLHSHGSIWPAILLTQVWLVLTFVFALIVVRVYLATRRGPIFTPIK